ncbi:hypothetical protein GCM10010357_66840 [Streptomyces luteireticuli]|uniref:EGF-like domain-containing protein n=1 Tax=Streptomyces luteireticuli TaxID=173858 RepID=A0ABP3J0M9_9ACTN
MFYGGCAAQGRAGLLQGTCSCNLLVRCSCGPGFHGIELCREGGERMPLGSKGKTSSCPMSSLRQISYLKGKMATAGSDFGG